MRESRRRKKEKDNYLPKVGDTKEIAYLPRDVRLGYTKTDKYLIGWCTTTDTHQLWQVLPNNVARFLGFIYPGVSHVC